MGLNRQLANLPDAITTDTSNNVGIGGSPSGSYKFEVTGTSYHSAASTFGSTATATAFIPSGATIPTNGMYLSAANTLNFATNTTNRLVISASGNVGIGTNSPSTAGGAYTGLDIRGSGGASLLLGSTGTLYSYIYADSGALTIQTTSSLPITFVPNGTERMRITSGGLVGIGCTPSYTLQVKPTTNVNMIVTNNGANLQIGSSNDAGNAAIPINFTATSFTFNSAATFSSTISASGTQYLGAGFAVSNDSASTIRQAASGVADFSGTTVTFDLASIFPRLTFTNRGLSVTLQLVAIPTYTIASSAFVVLGRTGNSNVWSNTILANININGVAVNSVSATGTVITVVYSTGISGTAYINVATIG